jgi:hypothetical protein
VFENTGGLLDHQKAEGVARGGATQLNPGLKSTIFRIKTFSRHIVIPDGQATFLSSYK